MNINNRIISNKNYPYIIAELSANHNGSIERAFNSIKAAKEAGADAVKIQTYTADTMTIKSDRKEFQIKGGLWDGFDLYSLYKLAETPYDWHKPLFDYAQEIGITIFSSPFDETAVDLLENLNTPAYKLASFEITDLPLVKYIAQTNKPMIISTGMANIEEISTVVDVAKENGCRDLVLLHCISSYPAPPEQSNLRTIPDLKERFGVDDLTIQSLSDVIDDYKGEAEAGYVVLNPELDNLKQELLCNVEQLLKEGKIDLGPTFATVISEDGKSIQKITLVLTVKETDDD